MIPARQTICCIAAIGFLSGKVVRSCLAVMLVGYVKGLCNLSVEDERVALWEDL